MYLFVCYEFSTKKVSIIAKHRRSLRLSWGWWRSEGTVCKTTGAVCIEIIQTAPVVYFCTAIEQILYQVNFDNRAFLVGVEDEGSVGVLIAIEVGEGQTVSFEFFRQISESLLDVDDGVADMQTLRRLDVVGDGRWRMLSLQRISPGEKLGGVRALDG